MKRVLKGVGIALLVILLALVVVNWNSWDDGVLYLQDMAAYTDVSPRPLNENGRFGFCNQLVMLRNAQRAEFIENYLNARGIAVERLPIYPATNERQSDNLLVTFGETGPYTIYSAHYDKRFDEPDYQGASDNTASVCMLLVTAEELSKTPPSKPIAILFIGEEEVGILGAKAFYEYATANNFQVAQVLNFDSMGRAGLAARAAGVSSGFVFTIPLVGDYVYDGRSLYPAAPYRQPDANLITRLQRLVPFAVFDRMVANSDGTYLYERGWNAINFTSDDIYYLDVTWHLPGDRLELVDESNFDRAVDLMLAFAREAN